MLWAKQHLQPKIPRALKVAADHVKVLRPDQWPEDFKSSLPASLWPCLTGFWWQRAGPGLSSPMPFLSTLLSWEKEDTRAVPTAVKPRGQLVQWPWDLCMTLPMGRDELLFRWPQREGQLTGPCPENSLGLWLWLSRINQLPLSWKSLLVGSSGFRARGI